MNKINARIIADSKNEFGSRITSFVLTYPRIIHAEFMTHRVFSRNAASSRAVPVSKMIAMIEEDPFIPIAFQKEHKGMQGSEYFNDEETEKLRKNWLLAKNFAIQEAKILQSFGVTKQLVNRLLEPYQWYTVICTTTEWENFWDLRCPKYYFEPENKYFRSRKDFGEYWFDCFGSGVAEAIDSEEKWLTTNHGQAEIHMMALAEAMWDAYNESIPRQLNAGEWHIPFGDNIQGEKLTNTLYYLNGESFLVNSDHLTQAKMEIATARCARVSYMNYEGTDDYEKDFKLYKQLKDSKHMSPFEHCAKAMSAGEYDSSFHAGHQGDGPDFYTNGWCKNFRGFIQLRALIE